MGESRNPRFMNTGLCHFPTNPNTCRERQRDKKRERERNRDKKRERERQRDREGFTLKYVMLHHFEGSEALVFNYRWCYVIDMVKRPPF